MVIEHTVSVTVTSESISTTQHGGAHQVPIRCLVTAMLEESTSQPLKAWFRHNNDTKTIF
jgi:hypothetical protein